MYPDDENCQVSHETIYKTLFIQARGALKKEFIQYLRKPRAMRRSRHHTQKTKDHGRISNNSQIATLVERHTRYVMLVRVPSKDTKTVIDALIKQAHKLPR